MNYDLIKMLCKEKGVAIKLLAAKIKVSEVGLHQMIRDKAMKIEIIEKIAKVLGVHVSYFFENSDSVPASVIDNLKTEGLETPPPMDEENTEYIMVLDIPDSEKIKMLRELVSLITIQRNMQATLASIRQQKIEQLQAQLAAKSVK